MKTLALALSLLFTTIVHSADVDAIREKADKGDAEAQSNLGEMYAKGENIPKNDTEAVKWFRKAADQGYVDAQYNLGVTYESGNGVIRPNVGELSEGNSARGLLRGSTHAADTLWCA